MIDPATGVDLSGIPPKQQIVKIPPPPENALSEAGSDMTAVTTKRKQDTIQRIYSSLMAISINEDWDAPEEYVFHQYTAYINMYEAAQRGEFTTQKNAAVIAAHTAAKTRVAPFIDLLNTVKDKVKIDIDNGNLTAANNLLASLEQQYAVEIPLTTAKYNQIKTALDVFLV